MNEQIPHDHSNLADMDTLSASMQRLSIKIQEITDAVKSLHQERTQLEAKIEDAQKRIQHILSRLPEQSDGRQMNLLGEAAAPANPEDDNEPTTH
jgi:predicted  nucleic acid-binding Zn-ribbon protein